MGIDAASVCVTDRGLATRFRTGTLTNFAGIFVLCELAMMGGQNQVATGTEWLLVSTGAGAVYVNNYMRARHAGGSQETLSLPRAVSGTVFHVALIAGCIILLFGATAGLYIAAVAMVSLATTRFRELGYSLSVRRTLSEDEVAIRGMVSTRWRQRTRSTCCGIDMLR